MRADAFTTIRSVGGLLPADTLARIAEGRDLPGLTPADYHLVEGETARTAANRAWTRLTAAWTSFRAAFAGTAQDDATTGLTRERWLQVLFSELGYGRLTATPAGGIVVDGAAYPVSHQWGHVPVHLVGARVSLDRRSAGVAGAARSAPHSMVQEVLNRSDEHLWAFVSNGLRLRVLRDSASLVRQAFLEFDLEGMFEGEVFSDFVVLWLVCHQSRVEAEVPAQCWLERWRTEAATSGIRALQGMRTGVTEALRTLGTGFLTHPDNQALRAALSGGGLSTRDYYRALLRLVYRLLFLFVAEDRALLLDPSATPAARRRYTDYFSTARLRRLALRRRGSRHTDLWAALQVVFDALASDAGRPQLGLPALDGALFDAGALGLIGEAQLSNADLLVAVRSLSVLADRSGTPRAVDYRNLGAEELGSVYESLLEFAPQHDPATGEFRLTVLAGNERKTTGSYYTPSPLIDTLLSSSLDAVVEEARRQPEPETALLSLKVLDPACGSGHFLVAVARRIARALAGVRTGETEPAPEASRAALRDVVGRCLYGVDVNPLSIELAKVSLWLEAIEPGKPLSFLDAHLKVGNSLLGVPPKLLAQGVPDRAFAALPGDDRRLAAALAKRNRLERQTEHQGVLFEAADLHVGNAGLRSALGAVERHDDQTISGVRARGSAFRRYEASPELRAARLLADAWCAAYLWPAQPGMPEAPTHRVLSRLSDDGPAALPPATQTLIDQLAREYGFFHWHLEFPDVFEVPDDPEAVDATPMGWRGGFSTVVGNPPWESLELKDEEFFSSSRPDIVEAKNAAARQLAIARLEQEDRGLFLAYQRAKRDSDGRSHMVRVSGRYPLCGRGKVNTYSVFAETARDLLAPRGRMGMVLPTGIATDATTQHFFSDLVRTSTLVSFLDFENEAYLLSRAVHHSVRFCLLTVGGRMVRTDVASFAFFTRYLEDLPDRRFAMSPEEILLLNPNTGTCPVFRSRRDAEITLGIYRRVPVLVRDGDPDGNPWGVSFMQGLFNMATDSGLFRTRAELEAEGWTLEGNIFARGTDRFLPLYEAKMLHHFDHRFGTYEGQTQAQANMGTLPRLTPEQQDDPHFSVLPRYWVPSREVDQRLQDRWKPGWLFGFRDICRSTDERTAIFSVFPRSGVGHTNPLVLPSNSHLMAAGGLVASMSTFVLDYCTRQKLGGTHLTYSYLEQLPVPNPAVYQASTPWQRSGRLGDWIYDRVLELTYTTWDMRSFALDLGYEGPPFRWDENRRALQRAELDAAYFHLYGIGRNDVEHIMESFPVVKQRDEARFGEYRTKRLSLEVYDRMAQAIADGSTYETLLDPPPGKGPTHPDRERSASARGASVS